MFFTEVIPCPNRTAIPRGEVREGCRRADQASYTPEKKEKNKRPYGTGAYLVGNKYEVETCFFFYIIDFIVKGGGMFMKKRYVIAQ